MFRLHFTWVFCLSFGVLASASVDEFDYLFNDEQLPLLSDGLEVNINKLIDDNIESIENVLQKFDPAQLPDVPLLGKGQLTDGWLSILAKMKRSGDCSLKYNDKILSIDIKVGWDLLKYDFDYAFKLWLIQRYGKVHGSVEKLNVNLKLYVDLRNYVIVLEEFRIGNVGKLGLELEGTFGDKIRSFFAKIIMNLAKKHIMNAVEGVASNVIEEKMKELNKQISNKDRHFRYIDLVKMKRNSYAMEEYIEENY